MQSTYSLRSGLHNAMSFNASRIGDYAMVMQHLQRNVELSDAAGNPVDGFSGRQQRGGGACTIGPDEAAQRVARIHADMSTRSNMISQRFNSNLLCSRVNFLAGDITGSLACADAALQLRAAASPEYMKRILVYAPPRAGASRTRP